MNDTVFKQNLKSLVDEYKQTFPNEIKRLKYLDEVLEKYPTFRKFSDRTTMPGHLTSSAIILSRTTGRILTVYKPALKMHLQPGGHINEGAVTPFHSVVQHMENRLPKKFVNRLTYLQWHYDPLVPMDIDIHHIEHSTQDGESAHTHFDMRYLFLGDENMLSMDDDMSRQHRPEWHDLNYMRRINSFHSIIEKINMSLTTELSRRRFYSEIIQNIIPKRASIVAVAHIIPDVVDYLMNLSRVFDLKGVIAKPKSINKEIKKNLLRSGIPIVEISREVNVLEAYLDDQIQNSSLPVILMDIGGWFAPVIESLSKKYKEKLIGIVEDTENGHQKYENLQKLQNLPLPVFSVARSPLKDFEDFLIGKSIVYSADAVLRDQSKLMEYLKCSVIGYGKIGRSIAQHLSTRGIQPAVYDINPLRRLEAYNRTFMVPARSEMLSSSDVIFSATGGQATNVIDFKLLKSGCYVFSVTSSDDEFDFSYLNNEYNKEKINKFIDKWVGPTNYFYLVCDGNAVNFVHGACVGDFIQLVRSEMLRAAGNLSVNIHPPGLHTTDDSMKESIADTWLRAFLRINDLLFEKDRDKALPKFIQSLDGISFS